jgi:hypothetical protein
MTYTLFASSLLVPSLLMIISMQACSAFPSVVNVHVILLGQKPLLKPQIFSVCF